MIAKNRFLQKKFLESEGIPTPAFRLARNHRELVVAHKALGFPGVLELQFVDADGAGPWLVRDFDDVPRVLRETKGRPLIWERALPFDRTYSLEVERDADGTLHFMPEVAGAARGYAATIGERLGIVGTYYVTVIESGEQAFVDEIAWS